MSSDLIASQSDLTIQTGRRVTLHFSLLFPTGEEIDTTRNGKPASFIVGDGNLLPGFEAVLLGKTTGYAEQITLPPDQAFGDHNPDNVRLLPRSRFADIQDDLEEGLMVSFQSPEGELPGVVVEVFEETLKVDFNHPLSGREIVFDVAILSVQDAQAGDLGS